LIKSLHYRRAQPAIAEGGTRKKGQNAQEILNFLTLGDRSKDPNAHKLHLFIRAQKRKTQTKALTIFSPRPGLRLHQAKP